MALFLWWNSLSTWASPSHVVLHEQRGHLCGVCVREPAEQNTAGESFLASLVCCPSSLLWVEERGVPRVKWLGSVVPHQRLNGSKHHQWVMVWIHREAWASVAGPDSWADGFVFLRSLLESWQKQTAHAHRGDTRMCVHVLHALAQGWHPSHQGCWVVVPSGLFTCHQ